MSRLDELYEEYRTHVSGMQSGVAMKMQIAPSETQPKHLRVGVNSAMSDHGALVKLLLEKGVFTEEEYVEKLVEFAKREKESYEQWLSANMGVEVKLGSL